MSTRKEHSENHDAPDRCEADDADALPVRRRQSTALLDAPKKGLEVVVERGASAYFSTCRRIAQFLNQRD